MSKTKAPKTPIAWTVSETDKITEERCAALGVGDRVRVGKNLTFIIAQLLIRRTLALKLVYAGVYDVIALPTQTDTRPVYLTDEDRAMQAPGKR